MEGDQPGVTTAAPADGASSSQAPTAPTNGSEAVTNSDGGQQEQTVPFTRFQEVNDKAKADKDRADKAERELEELRQQQTTSKSSTEDEDDIDPSVDSLVSRIIEKKGYVKKEDVDSAVQAVEARQQYAKDVADLTSKYAQSGIPFVEKSIREYAVENGINITSKTSLDAAYKQMNYDKILEAARNSAVTEFKEGGKTSAEKPGSSGAKAPEEKEVHGLKNRIRAARERIAS